MPVLSFVAFTLVNIDHCDQSPIDLFLGVADVKGPLVDFGLVANILVKMLHC